MKEFKPIIYDDKLSAFNLSNKLDLFSTKVVLDDYDWMNYKVIGWLPTKEYGDIKITFVYTGAGPCEMIIKTKSEIHAYTFSYEIFKEHIVKFLTHHIEQWNSEYAFHGKKDIVDFYNAVITDPKTIHEKSKRRRYHSLY